MPSAQATRTLVKTIAENFHLPYYTLTPTFSICPNHGYLKGEEEKCPECGSTCEVWSRSVGYLRPVDQWNPGKQSEYEDRVTYDRQLEKQALGV
jgi:ribonucleoside-triphosphate reductase